MPFGHGNDGNPPGHKPRGCVVMVHIPDEVIDDMGDDPSPAEVADRLSTLWLELNNSQELVDQVRAEEAVVR